MFRERTTHLKYSYRMPLAVLVLLLAACAAQQRVAAPDNGRSIFVRGRDSRGRAISASPRPLYSSCAACHGVRGTGGVHLPGGAVSADLRHDALITHQRHPYTMELLERAISHGIDNEGQRLNVVMPRWHMSKKDLRDVAAYVMTLK